MTAIRKDHQIHPRRSSEIHELIQRAPNGATRKKNVVHQKNDFTGNIKGQVGFLNDGMQGRFTRIVSIKGDVQTSYGKGRNTFLL